MLAELTDVLGRRKFNKKIAASGQTIDQLIDGYASLALLVHAQSVPRIASDPDDDVVLGTALAAGAEMIVTGDKPLLLVAAYQGVKLVRVTEAINAIEARHKA